MSALLQSAANVPQKNNSITSISVNARVDYILRFSKQAVLVVDESSEAYGLVASKFLGALPDTHNAALLSVSSRHNDIQIRCRIIEQLFGSVLFDPEQPLFVSILHFAKNSSEPISIVLEQSQNLSVQLMHELCQLAEIAKKHHIILNVLMAGNLDAGALVAQNKILFKGKLSLLSAISGQLIPINHPMFKSTSNFNLGYAVKILLLLVFIGVLTIFGTLALDRYQVIDIEAILGNGSHKPLADSKINTEQFVLPLKTKSKESLLKAKTENNSRSVENTQEKVLMQTPNSEPVNTNTPESSLIEKAPIEPASVGDVVMKNGDNVVNSTTLLLQQSAHVKNQAEDILVVNPTSSIKVIEQVSAEPKVEATSMETLTPLVKASVFNTQTHYYQEYSSGFVIQISGFTQFDAYQEFIQQFPQLTYYSYMKQVNDREMMIMTTPVYESKTMANAALKELPVEIQSSGAWVKSITVINAEIDAFNTAIR